MPRVLRTGIVASDVATVNAAGDAVVRIAPNTTQFNWSVSQISLEMPNAPVGTLVELRRNGNFIDAPFSARRASAGGDPAIVLRSGDDITVEWSGATPTDQGRVTWIYDEVPLA